MAEVFICPFCGRNDIYRKCSFTQHIKRCKENPDRVELNEETRKKMSESHKGQTSGMKGKTLSEETRKKMSEALKGKTSPMKGKTHSEEARKKISEAAKHRTYSDETRKKMSEGTKKAYENPELRQKLSDVQKIVQNRPEVRQKNSENQKIAQNRPETRQKWYNTKKQNNSFNTSKIEEQLKEYFTSHNIKFKTQYKSDKYPFMCDFYFPDKDLYVEIQGTWTHGGRPYISTDEDCIEQLELWKSKNKPFYLNAIDTWTNRDVNKRNWAKEHNLNWTEIFSDDFETCITDILKLL